MNNNLICSGRTPSAGSLSKLTLQHTLQTSGQIALSYQPSTLPKQPNSITDFPGFTNYVESRFQNSLTRQPQFVTQSPVEKRPHFTVEKRPQFNVEKRPQKVPQFTVESRPQVPQFTVESRSQAPPDSISRVNQICGTAVFIPRPLVVGGEAIAKGSWPWLVAVYINDAKGLAFKCGGNLVTSRTVITAAHCLKLRGMEYKAKNVLIVAGRHNLLDWSESTSITFNADRVFIHPDYKDSLSSFDGDVAMVIADETIR